MQSQAEVFHLGRVGKGHSCHVALTTSDPVGSAASPLACHRNPWIGKNNPTSFKPNDIGASMIGKRHAFTIMLVLLISLVVICMCIGHLSVTEAVDDSARPSQGGPTRHVPQQGRTVAYAAGLKQKQLDALGRTVVRIAQVTLAAGEQAHPSPSGAAAHLHSRLRLPGGQPDQGWRPTIAVGIAQNGLCYRQQSTSFEQTARSVPAEDGAHFEQAHPSPSGAAAHLQSRLRLPGGQPDQGWRPTIAVGIAQNGLYDRQQSTSFKQTARSVPAEDGTHFEQAHPSP